MGTEHEIQFGVLGPLQMSVGDSCIAVGTPKQRAVLAMLIANPNRAISAAELITAIWDDEPPAAARISLIAYVSNLRRIMAQAGVDPHAVLATAPPPLCPGGVGPCSDRWAIRPEALTGASELTRPA